MTNKEQQAKINDRRRLRPGKVAIALVILGMGLLDTDCGYHLAGKGISLPQQYWQMAIPVFENQTPQQEIAQTITLAVIEAFSRHGELKIVPLEKANSTLSGTILNYREQPQNISNSSLAKSYRIFITASVKLIDRKTEKPFWEDQKMYFSQDYDVSEYLGQTEFSQKEARRLAAVDFAERLVSIILEGF
jgi:hypothetical protein